MKNILILTILITVAFTSYIQAQQIPNPSFETWVNRGIWGFLPRDWYGTNYSDFVNHVGVTRIADNAVDGQYHVKMEAKSINFFGSTYKIPGGLTLSDLYHATGVDFFKEGKPKAGVAFAGTPSRVTGYYKYKPVNNSEFYMSAVLTKWRGTYRDTIAIAEKRNNQLVTEWTPFELALEYRKSENPDTLNIVFLTSAVFKEADLPKVQPGTTMEIDHLGLVMADYFKVNYTTEGNPCTGNTLIFKASSENIPASRWEWYIGPTYAGNQQTLSYKFPEVTEPTDFNVRLRGVSPIGNDEVTKIITIHPNPDIRLLPENPEICPGSTITLTATGGETYTWNVTGAVNNQITVTPTLGSLYEIIGRDQYGCTNFASSRIFYHNLDTTNLTATFCKSSSYNFLGRTISEPGIYFHNLKSVITGCDSTLRLTLNELPISNLSVISDRNYICPGQLVNLTATEGFESYDWGKGPSSNNTLEVNPKATTTYYVTAKMVNGCYVTDSLTIEIAPPFVNEQQKNICFGDSILIFGNWKYTSGTFEEIFKNINGCDSIVRIMLNVLPIPEPDLQADKLAICAGDSVTLSAKSGYANYIWTPESLNQNRINIVPSESMIIKLHVFSEFGCRSSDSIYIFVIESEITEIQTEICPGDSLRIGSLWVKEPGIYNDTLRNESGCNGIIRNTVSFKNIPTLELTGYSMPVCQGEILTLTATPGWSSYQWNNGNITGNTYTTTLWDSGHISLKVTALNGCMKNENILIEVNPNPKVFSLSGSGTYSETEEGRTILLNGSETGITYRLFKNGLQNTEIQGTGNSLNFGIHPEGIYWVNAINQQNCTSVMNDTVAIQLLTNIPNVVNAPTLFIYPNPTRKIIYFSTSVNGSVIISDNTGRMVKQYPLLNGNSINISGLKPGLYHVIVIENSLQHYLKVMVIQ